MRTQALGALVLYGVCAATIQASVNPMRGSSSSRYVLKPIQAQAPKNWNKYFAFSRIYPLALTMVSGGIIGWYLPQYLQGANRFCIPCIGPTLYVPT
jgi:hypothetical protein